MIDTAFVISAFTELETICATAGRQLWGIPLYGPVLVIDPKNRSVVASRPDKEGLLSFDGTVYHGWFPEDKVVANSTTSWGGLTWSMVLWPLPATRADCVHLMVHELFHYHQPALGLSGFGGMPDNAHLETMDGRMLLQLEWTALMAALGTSGDARRETLATALTLRRMRRSQFGCADAENRLEILEGTAEYTAMAVCLPDRTARGQYLQAQWRKIASSPSYVRSFAYFSGPIYGALLDDAEHPWRESLRPESDLGALLSAAYVVEPGPDIKPENLALYGYAALLRREKALDDTRRRIEDEHRARFVHGPTLRLPLSNMQISFDPNRLQPLPGHGTVYHGVTIACDWGTLRMSDGGCLVSEDWKTAFVPAERYAIDGNTIASDGWMVTLQGSAKLDCIDGNPTVISR